ncbi:efflux RND transporter periplasmic adaptor subunit [Rhizobium sp. L1K21]|uniref:efflux RND transporter periplasmic adaptor subunit n=1 Tax=Rhizobium sp. L1K21 TaxID=2954933 RepID=UPI002093E341|nr:efflux RND transporter periplasmic adaptor subunit [Rhizobium sp. L1K21]MCO6185693.1 efflux RND transporter periplasmic adaptor subunit [Rhizobium sp. L1K21]
MRFWKQLFLSLVVVIVALVIWARFVPGSRETLATVGMPEFVVGLLTPEGADTASGEKPSRGGFGGMRGFGGPAQVVAQPVESAVANDRLVAIGNGAAIRSVSVSPDESGKLAEILVRSGQKVEAGDVLARLDNREQVIARDRAQLEYQTAQEKVQRYTSLKGNLSKVELDDAVAAEKTAKLALESAELALEKRDIVAPIDGVAGIVDVNLGDNLTSSSTVVTIDDRSSILIEFWAPERFSGSIETGMPISAIAIAQPGVVHEGKIAAVDSRVDEASRTVRVRAEVPNQDDTLRAGMSFRVTLHFDGQNYAAVNPVSIQWDSKGSYVWKVVDGKANRSGVRIIQRNPENVLVEGEVEPGDMIVTEGVQRVRQGGDVKLIGDDGAGDGKSESKSDGATS